MPRLPAAPVTVVWNAAWPASASVIEIVPTAVKVAGPESSVTFDTDGLPMTAGVLPPPPDTTLRLKTVGAAQFPSDAEVEANVRARSAVLRVAERLA